eukprot:5866158-Pyramimonas_sp.AAC.1
MRAALGAAPQRQAQLRVLRGTAGPETRLAALPVAVTDGPFLCWRATTIAGNFENAAAAFPAD